MYRQMDGKDTRKNTKNIVYKQTNTKTRRKRREKNKIERERKLDFEKRREKYRTCQFNLYIQGFEDWENPYYEPDFNTTQEDNSPNSFNSEPGGIFFSAQAHKNLGKRSDEIEKNKEISWDGQVKLSRYLEEKKMDPKESREIQAHRTKYNLPRTGLRTKTAHIGGRMKKSRRKIIKSRKNTRKKSKKRKIRKNKKKHKGGAPGDNESPNCSDDIMAVCIRAFHAMLTEKGINLNAENIDELGLTPIREESYEDFSLRLSNQQDKKRKNEFVLYHLQQLISRHSEYNYILDIIIDCPFSKGKTGSKIDSIIITQFPFLDPYTEEMD